MSRSLSAVVGVPTQGSAPEARGPASAAARIVAILVLGRVARERASQLREEMAQERLGQALERQREELARLEEAVARAQGRS